MGIDVDLATDFSIEQDLSWMTILRINAAMPASASAVYLLAPAGRGGRKALVWLVEQLH